MGPWLGSGPGAPCRCRALRASRPARPPRCQGDSWGGCGRRGSGSRQKTSTQLRPQPIGVSGVGGGRKGPSLYLWARDVQAPTDRGSPARPRCGEPASFTFHLLSWPSGRRELDHLRDSEGGDQGRAAPVEYQSPLVRETPSRLLHYTTRRNLFLLNIFLIFSL